ncbi:MAG: zinc ribbon domain-containing protein [Candidatus Helarchaeota archaeon]
MSDRKRWAMVRKQLYVAVKKAASLDELISIMKSWYAELKGDEFSVDVPVSQINAHVSSSPNINVSPQQVHSSGSDDVFEQPEKFDMENLDGETKIITCPHCNEKIEYTRGTVFCPNCGIPID